MSKKALHEIEINGMVFRAESKEEAVALAIAYAEEKAKMEIRVKESNKAKDVEKADSKGTKGKKSEKANGKAKSESKGNKGKASEGKAKGETKKRTASKGKEEKDTRTWSEKKADFAKQFTEEEKADYVFKKNLERKATTFSYAKANENFTERVAKKEWSKVYNAILEEIKNAIEEFTNANELCVKNNSLVCLFLESVVENSKAFKQSEKSGKRGYKKFVRVGATA